MRVLSALLVVLLAACAVFAGSTVVIMRHADAEFIGDLAHETFDPTGYDLTWSAASENSGTVDPDSTTDPPISSTGFSGQSVYFNGNQSGNYNNYRIRWDAGSAQTTVYQRFYVYISGWTPTWNQVAIISAGHTSSSAPMDETTNTWRLELFQFENTGWYLRMHWGNDAVTAQTFSITTATTPKGPYRVEIMFSENGTSDSYEWRIDGTTIASGTANIGAAPRYFSIGKWGYNGAALYVDKYDLDSDEWPGAAP